MSKFTVFFSYIQGLNMLVGVPLQVLVTGASGRTGFLTFTVTMSLCFIPVFFFGFSNFPILITIDFTARTPRKWRWSGETRVIPYLSKIHTTAQPQAGQQYVVPAQSSLLDRQCTTFVSSFQRQVHGAKAAKSSVTKGENSAIKKNSLGHNGYDQGKPSLGHSRRAYTYIYVYVRIHVRHAYI